MLLLRDSTHKPYTPQSFRNTYMYTIDTYNSKILHREKHHNKCFTLKMIYKKTVPSFNEKLNNIVSNNIAQSKKP